MACGNMQTVVYTRENLKKVIERDKVYILFQMGHITKENTMTIWSMVEANLYLKSILMKENFNTVRPMEGEKLLIMMELYLMVITNKIWKVDMGSYMRLMELFIKGNGEKESNYSIIKFILLDIIFNLIMFLLY